MQTDVSAFQFQSSLSCGTDIREVIEVSEKYRGNFEKGHSELDFNSVTFDADHGFQLVISEEKGLLYGASVHVNSHSGGEFLCCEGLPQ